MMKHVTSIVRPCSGSTLQLGIDFLIERFQIFVQRQQDVGTSGERPTRRQPQEVHTADVQRSPGDGRSRASDGYENRAGHDWRQPDRRRRLRLVQRRHKIKPCRQTITNLFFFSFFIFFFQTYYVNLLVYKYDTATRYVMYYIRRARTRRIATTADTSRGIKLYYTRPPSPTHTRFIYRVCKYRRTELRFYTKNITNKCVTMTRRKKTRNESDDFSS